MRGFAIEFHPFAIGENRWIKFHSGLFLCCILSFEVIIVNGIEESGSVNADCGFEANADIAVVNSRGFTVLRHLKRDIVGILRNGNFRIYERICFSVRESVAPFVSILRPFNHNLALVNRSLERLYGKGLRHTCQRT